MKYFEYEVVAVNGMMKKSKTFVTLGKSQFKDQVKLEVKHHSS